MASTDAVPDVLGTDYFARTLELRSDDEGEVVATLVKRVVVKPRTNDVEASPPSSRAVLYVHGFVDYFLQTHLAQQWVDAGYAFYALDLRKCGRSLRGHQTPNYVTTLHAYDEELDEAVALSVRKTGIPH